ncbi:MAG: PorT family protein [Bacteroidales bacterium]|jgi:opacity protein-like surface antigen|nr:PorT family protein [Bacteroidales bacterium]
MKKLFVVIAVAIVTAGSMQAQFKIGPRVGLSLTNMKVSGEDDIEGLETKSKSRLGFQIGVLAEYSLTDAFAINAGVNYAQLGGKQDLTFAEEDITLTAKTRLNYLQVPINAQYKFGKFYVQAGPYVGFGLSGKVKTKVKGDLLGLASSFAPEDQDVKFGSKKGTEANDFEDGDDLKTVDFGVGLGLGLALNHFQIGLGYNLGLTNISIADEGKIKNNGFSLTAAFLFGK